MNNIDYFAYKSPEAEIPAMGVLAAEAVRQITAYLKNDCLNVANSIRVPLAQALALPPLQTYTYMSALNQIVKRTVREDDAGDGPATPAKNGSKTKKQSTPGSATSSGTDVPTAPVPKGVPTPQGAPSDQDDLDEEEGVDHGELAADDELQALEEMQQSVAKGKRKRGNAKNAAKPKAKVAAA